jgi:penicillin-binding protein 1C
MHDVSGVTGAAPVWLEIMSWLHRAEPSVGPAPPPGLSRQAVGPAESPRPEWFVAGTEPARQVTAVAPLPPRILAPAPGTIVAVDPDIPPARQRVVFEARPALPDLRWYLDDTELGPAAGRVLWPPVRGRHTLSIAAPDRTVLDRVTFEVR